MHSDHDHAHKKSRKKATIYRLLYVNRIICHCTDSSPLFEKKNTNIYNSQTSDKVTNSQLIFQLSIVKTFHFDQFSIKKLFVIAF